MSRPTTSWSNSTLPLRVRERSGRLADALETLLGAPVDLVDPRCIRNPYLAAEVERTRRPVDERSPTQAAE